MRNAHGFLYLIVHLATVWALPVFAIAEPERKGEPDITEGRQWVSNVEGIAISIATDKQRYAPGEQIVLNVLLKNVGNSEVHLWETYVLDSYRPTVFLPDGKKSPLTLDGRIANGDDLGGAPRPLTFSRRNKQDALNS